MRQDDENGPIEAQALALLDTLWADGFIEGRPYPAAMVATIVAALERMRRAPDPSEVAETAPAIAAPMDPAEIVRMFATIPFR
ncbi:hypothetical protein [Variibacter gotjawalensis]|uniref:hypothetical protein n=1 Tax=Variibacter gotjawalensis TaxID=1333996 RepID=UPI000BBB5D69|nr:hypothetical protein [Variibacter gotjawalensis]NIK49170.1 hypothetical protein [Variibacter gotjawalensis]